MQEQEKDDIERQYSKKPKRKVVKEVEEIDSHGNIRKVMREVEEEGIARAPKTRDLKQKVVIDKDGHKKTVLVDDEGNIVDEDDIE